MLSFDCICYDYGVSSGVSYVTETVHKRCLPIPNDDGHEYISLMPFSFVLIFPLWRLGGTETVAPDTNL